MHFFKLPHFSLIAIDSHETLNLALGLVEIHLAVASSLVATKFSYLSFGVCFRSLRKSIKLVSYSYSISIFNIPISEDQTYCDVLTVCVLFLCCLREIFAETTL